MKYFLKTTYPCLIKTDNSSCELDENDLLEIDDEKYIYIYPENSGIPFYINLSVPKENKNFSIIRHGDKKIIFLDSKQNLKIEEKESLNICGKTCNVYISDNSITFENNSKKLTYLCPHINNNYKIFKIKNFACVQFDKNLYIFNISNNKLSHISGDEITFNNNLLKVIKKFNDSDEKIKTSIYKFDEEVILEKEEFNYSQNKAPDDLLPYKTLECIQARDYKNALNFLSDKLKSKINEKSLQSFFGKINKFLPLSTTEFITICGKEKKFVTFNLENDKIDDILIDDL